MTKLYNNLYQEIDTPERNIVLTNPVTTLNNKIFFNFNLTPNLLYYDLNNLISSIVKLLIIVKVEDQVLLRRLELSSNKVEIIPQIGGLITLNVNYDDALNYQTSPNNNKVTIIVVFSIIGLLIAIMLSILCILLYFVIYSKKNSNSTVNPHNIVEDQISVNSLNCSKIDITSNNND